MEMEITKENLENIKKFCADKLSKFLVNNITDFVECAFILQSILNAISEAENSLE